MAKKKLIPRKKPAQQRAHATVEAILQAATYILVRGGWDKLTTNSIAERAGVNIASLYQYFPNKEAIMVELQRRHLAKARTGFPEALARSREQKGVRDILYFLVEAAVQEHRVAPALHRAFNEELPRSTRYVEGRREETLEQLQQLLLPYIKNLPNRELAVFITRAVVHAVIHESASHKPELLDNPALVEEVVGLLAPYLERTPPPEMSQKTDR
jgi:AcrR family transcriptional regulator